MNTSDVDFNLLATLEALLAERNVTHAARRLRISQPALSSRLGRLRELFGDQLLVPGHRGMTPTAKALELEEPLKAALNGLRGVVAAACGFDPSTDRLVVNIAASDYMQASVLLDFTLALRQEAPGIRIALRNIDVSRLEGHMEEGTVDLAFLTPDLIPDALRSRPLLAERYVLIARKAHPAAPRGLTAEAFARLDHVIVSPRGGGFCTAADNVLESMNLRRNVVMSASSFLVVLDAVRNSDVVALVPERLVRNRVGNLRVLEPPIPVPGFSVSMAWHERGHGDLAQRWFRQKLLEHVASQARTRPL
ncbi:LysR family transcriptional regulator [Massilia dura]|uniref:LysR family transcriptional regulator n=1 Tax=Pseudoduganella dura TaxID=321982 RepID=A0A6I3XJP0_9BURK|nr:LysR family transcriptional regulator [Pseudoduganella dura]MUI14760.1 LysR family transcriptional regulator [Pseudoduganella dura]GGX98233.1 LysR family transcriptional regulator [Pseudoduganella dura]